ncbi:hypothetical protein PtA15_3A185 [Puccinia triticina]|uniref:Uncharacterized protein n=1 Tax=Puccinia triticina TaxID=208348 RepID=A0ABY7CC72_9BASI|nr:uncharacterized protein PtA15_3A185 [Puccinia triticina]WAQ82821.1 hypothetical protein PtA15_3A185 [Puccinia triticina]
MGTTDNKFEVIKEDFAELMKQNQNLEFIDTLEKKLATDESPKKRSFELNSKIMKVKENLWGISQLFLRLGDLPKSKEKELYLRLSYLLLQFSTENYGRDLLEEDKIGGNFTKKFEAMSYSTEILSRLDALESAVESFGENGLSIQDSPTIHEWHELGKKIVQVIPEKDKLNALPENPELNKYNRLDEINHAADSLFQGFSLQFFEAAYEKLKLNENQVEPETEKLHNILTEQIKKATGKV